MNSNATASIAGAAIMLMFFMLLIWGSASFVANDIIPAHWPMLLRATAAVGVLSIILKIGDWLVDDLLP